MHAAHTSFYTPFPAGMLEAGGVLLPVGYTENSFGATDRGTGAWQAAHNSCVMTRVTTLT